MGRLGWATLAILVVLGWMMLRLPHAAKDAESKPKLFVFCAAGIKPPIEAAAAQFERETGIQVDLQYGGSGTLLSNLRIAQRGDLYIAGDESYIELAREKGLIRGAFPLAQIRPVIAVRQGNPERIRSIRDLLRSDVSVSLTNPEAASAGKLVKELLEASKQWEPLAAKAKVFKPTVPDVAADVQLGAVDAGIVWDANVRQQPTLEMVEVPEFADAKETVMVGVLTTCSRPEAAEQFVEYLQAPGTGGAFFKRFGYAPASVNPTPPNEASHQSNAPGRTLPSQMAATPLEARSASAAARR